MKQKGCPFCDHKALAHEVFYETQSFLCVSNLRPVFPGHSLIIPKRHMATILKMNEQEIEELPSVIKMAFVALKKAYKAQGFNIILQEGAVAGASINHVHFHILPRREGDIPSRKEWIDYFHRHELTRRAISNEEMAAEVAKIKRAIDGLGR